MIMMIARCTYYMPVPVSQRLSPVPHSDHFESLCREHFYVCRYFYVCVAVDTVRQLVLDRLVLSKEVRVTYVDTVNVTIILIFIIIILSRVELPLHVLCAMSTVQKCEVPPSSPLDSRLGSQHWTSVS